MDGSRFDAWTRRGIGLAAGGIAATLLGLTRRDIVEASKKGKKRKRRRKRCLRFDAVCTSGGKRCCKNLSRDLASVIPLESRCCKGFGAPCSGPGECCPVGLDCNTLTGKCDLGD